MHAVHTKRNEAEKYRREKSSGQRKKGNKPSEKEHKTQSLEMELRERLINSSPQRNKQLN